MKTNSKILRDVGKYQVIRSSETKDAMICWNTPQFNAEHGRWYETCGGGFASWVDVKYMQETDDLEMEEFRSEHPDLRVRESFLEVEYGDGYYSIAKIWAFLAEYDGRKSRSFAFDLKDLGQEDLEVCTAAIWNWHDTGELKTAHMECYPCCGPWEEN